MVEKRRTMTCVKCWVSFLLFMLGSVGVVGAQEGQDEGIGDAGLPEIFAEGAVFASEKERASLPKTPIHRAFLPPISDLTRYFPKPGNQGQQGSCVGWSVGYAARAYYSAARENKSVASRKNIPSPAYVYNMIKRTPGKCSEGTRITDALDLLQQGALSLAAYPYSARRCNRPSRRQKSDATGFKIKDWYVVDDDNLDQIKAELKAGHPVIISLKTNKKFHRLRGREVWRAGPTDLGGTGHAVTLVGYNEHKQRFKFINSWGRRWGSGGFGWMTYQTFLNRVREAYVMRLADVKPVPILPKVVIPPAPVVPIPPQPGPNPPIIPDKPDPDPHLVKVEGIECGKVDIVQAKDQLKAVGFVGKKSDLELLEKQLKGKVAELDVDVRPWPQCETLLTLDAPLKYQTKPVVSAEQAVVYEGDNLVFGVQTPGFHGYLHVAYVQADGKVVNLYQSSPLTLTTYSPGTRFKLGDGSDGGPKFTVSAPFGQEMIVAIASKSPLFSKERPLVETEREFLTALRKAILARPATSAEHRIVSADFITLTTNPATKE